MTNGQDVEKGSGPSVDVVGQYLPPQRPHSASPVVGWLVERRLDRVLDTFEVVRVDQVGLREFGCGASEFAEYERAAAVDEERDILLGNQVHPVPQRGD